MRKMKVEAKGTLELFLSRATIFVINKAGYIEIQPDIVYVFALDGMVQVFVNQAPFGVECGVKRSVSLQIRNCNFGNRYIESINQFTQFSRETPRKQSVRDITHRNGISFGYWLQLKIPRIQHAMWRYDPSVDIKRSLRVNQHHLLCRVGPTSKLFPLSNRI